MSILPRVTELTRESVAREFDDLGPDACVAAIWRNLEQHNPELLDIASKWAAEADEPSNLLTAFAMFYRLLTAQGHDPLGPTALSPLPRVSVETRSVVVSKIDQFGADNFTYRAIDRLEQHNPELLLMAHAFASERMDYVRTMQGFALLHETLLMQFLADRAKPH